MLLYELIGALKGAAGDDEYLPCVLRFHDKGREAWGDYEVEEITSWRGDYSEVSMCPKRRGETYDMTVGDLVDMLEAVIGTEVTGYKGGQFHVYPSTRVWADPYGIARCDGPTSVVLEEGVVVVNVHPGEY